MIFILILLQCSFGQLEIITGKSFLDHMGLYSSILQVSEARNCDANRS